MSHNATKPSPTKLAEATHPPVGDTMERKWNETIVKAPVLPALADSGMTSSCFPRGTINNPGRPFVELGQPSLHPSGPERKATARNVYGVRERKVAATS